MDDRDVLLKGRHLEGLRIDFVMGGGIAAVEAVKVIRELRRYGAEVRVLMTRAALTFVAPLALEWASKNKVVTELSGSAEHLSPADLSIVFPATFDLLGRVVHGLADDSALTALQSSLGRKPIIFCPSMHERLWENDLFQKNLSTLRSLPQSFCMDPLVEEGKRKSASVEEIVQRTISISSRSALKGKSIVLSMGATRSAMDDVRFITNSSSGATGLAIAAECFRRGANVFVAQGLTTISLPPWIVHRRADTGAEMQKVLQNFIRKERPLALIMAAAILDFEVVGPRAGKRSSNEKVSLTLKPSPKVMDSLQLKGMKKIGFKLEVGLSEERLSARIAEWNRSRSCDLVVANEKAMLSAAMPAKTDSAVRAILYDREGKQRARALSNDDLACKICEWLEDTLAADLKS